MMAPNVAKIIGLFRQKIRLRHMSFAFIVTLLAALSIFCFERTALAAPNASGPLTAHASIRGIYIVVPVKKPIDGVIAQALASPNVDGAFIKDTWANVQPSPQTYNWARLDEQLAKAKSLGKKVSIAVLAGASTPDWVYSSGARSFPTIVVQKKNPQFCQPIKIPVPWDPVYLKSWTKFVEAFGRHFANEPAIAMIKITGVNYHSDETMLPHANEEELKSIDGTRSCHVPDQIAQWSALGYTSSRVASAFHTITETFAQAFPGVPLAMMTGSSSFPTLGPDGRDDPQGAALATTDSDGIESLLTYGRRTLGARFIGQNNNLRAHPVDPGIAAFSATNPTGYQFDWPVHNDKNCIMGGGRNRCDSGDNGQGVIASAIDNALRAHAEFVELFAGDVNDPSFQETISAAHQQLSASH